MSDEEWPVDGNCDGALDSGGKLLLLLAVWLSLESERRLEDDDDDEEFEAEEAGSARPVMEETITTYSESRSRESVYAIVWNMIGRQATWLCSPAALS